MNCRSFRWRLSDRFGYQPDQTRDQVMFALRGYEGQVVSLTGWRAAWHMLGAGNSGSLLRDPNETGARIFRMVLRP